LDDLRRLIIADLKENLEVEGLRIGYIPTTLGENNV
jgi:hypothetical protein